MTHAVEMTLNGTLSHNYLRNSKINEMAQLNPGPSKGIYVHILFPVSSKLGCSSLNLLLATNILKNAFYARKQGEC